MLRLRPHTQFLLPPFELVPLEFQGQAGEPPDELVLDELVAGIGADAPVVRLVQPQLQPMPTAGELRESIERQLHRAQHRAPTANATDELRQALSDLRRSIG